MLRSRRQIEAPDLGAHLRNDAIVHSRYRLHAVHNARVISEDAMLLRAFSRSGATGRPVATLLLAGRACMTAHGRRQWIDPGHLLFMDFKGACQMRQEGDPYRAVVFEWDASLGARPTPFEVRALPAAELERAEALWLAARRTDSDALEVIQGIVALLRANGAPLAAPAREELSEPVDAATLRLAAALDRLLSELSSQPMMADLEGLLGFSARHVNRVVADFNASYGYNAEGWRDTRNRRRVMMGATLMTALGATAKRVAELVGYQSAAAFARALRLAKLPPPSAIVGVVTDLGKDDAGSGSGGQ